MDEIQLKRLKELSKVMNQRVLSKSEFMEYSHLNEMFFNEINLDQAKKRNKRFFDDL